MDNTPETILQSATSLKGQRRSGKRQTTCGVSQKIDGTGFPDGLQIPDGSPVKALCSPRSATNDEHRTSKGQAEERRQKTKREAVRNSKKPQARWKVSKSIRRQKIIIVLIRSLSPLVFSCFSVEQASSTNDTYAARTSVPPPST